MSKILITGVTGFIGSNLIKKLSTNNEIFVLVRKKSLGKFKKINNIKLISFSNLDILNKKLKYVKVDTIIHSATHYVKKHQYKDIKNLTNANITLGNVLLENLKSLKVKKFINISTVWEDYNGIKNNFPNLYAAYKKAFGMILNFYRKNNSDVRFYNILLSDTFGYNDKRAKLINILKKNIKLNKVTSLISKKAYINLLNVEDVAGGIAKLVKKNIKPGTYVLKNLYNYSFIQIINQVEKDSKKKIKIKWLGNKKFKEKIFNYKILPGWKPFLSSIKDISKVINN